MKLGLLLERREEEEEEEKRKEMKLNLSGKFKRRNSQYYMAELRTQMVNCGLNPRKQPKDSAVALSSFFLVVTGIPFPPGAWWLLLGPTSKALKAFMSLFSILAYY